MLSYVSEPKKVSKQCGRAKVGLDTIILLHIHNILSNIVRYLLILSDIVYECRISTNIVKYCHIFKKRKIIL